MLGLVTIEIDKFCMNFKIGEIHYLYKMLSSNNLSTSRTAERHSMLAVKNEDLEFGALNTDWN